MCALGRKNRVPVAIIGQCLLRGCARFRVRGARLRMFSRITFAFWSVLECFFEQEETEVTEEGCLSVSSVSSCSKKLLYGRTEIERRAQDRGPEPSWIRASQDGAGQRYRTLPSMGWFFLSSSRLVTMTSVVSNRAAMLAALLRAVRTTFSGSMMPASTRSQYSPTLAS